MERSSDPIPQATLSPEGKAWIKTRAAYLTVVRRMPQMEAMRIIREEMVNKPWEK